MACSFMTLHAVPPSLIDRAAAEADLTAEPIVMSIVLRVDWQAV